MAGEATILIVDDVPENVMVLGDLLGDDYEVRFALNGPDALTLAAEGDVDVILLDVMMPGLDGYEVCRRLKAHDRTVGIPIIFVTVRGGVEDEARGLALGAVDYIAKPVNAPIVKARVRTHVELKHRTDLLARMAQLDGLTGVANRRRLDQALAEEWGRAMRTGMWLSLVLLDIDHFKKYNDRYGHPAGDSCLKRLASSLVESSTRAGDLVARYGGEEFAALLPGTAPGGALQVTDKIRQGVRDLAIEHAASPVSNLVTVSVGVGCVVPDTDGSPSQLIATADRCLYAAKKQGRDRAVCEREQ